MFFRILIAALAALLLAACATLPAIETRAPVTILVAIDGFHPSYLERGVTPNLNALAARGAAAPMKPSFPTKTFPNHYTIVTGLHPDAHGIVENSMEDAARPGERFSLANTRVSLDRFWWDQAEPAITTATKAGIRTATMFWPGSEVDIQGVRPTNWHRFDQNQDGFDRVAALLDWLRRPAATRPQFLTLYFDTVDTAGHEFGPDHAETMAAVADVDARIGELVAGLAALNQPANIVVTSDHGMAATSSTRVIQVADLIDPAALHVLTAGPYLSFAAMPGRDAEVRAALLKPHAHMQCWTRETLPARFMYGMNPRVAPYLCLAETGWLIETRPVEAPFERGTHGYDNAAPEMRAIFIAAGRAIRAGARPAGVDAVDVYPLLARLVGFQPRPHQGDAAVAEAVLQ